MRKLVVFCLAGITVCGGVYYTTRLITKRTILAYAQAKISPFTAERFVYSYEQLASGKLVEKEITAVDSQGSRAIVSTTTADPSRYMLRRVERVDGLYARLADDLHLISTVHKNN